ncbi:MAG: nucleoside-diphosphate kinase [Candidatus Competibacteraceae bacterium]
MIRFLKHLHRLWGFTVRLEAVDEDGKMERVRGMPAIEGAVKIADRPPIIFGGSRFTPKSLLEGLGGRRTNSVGNSLAASPIPLEHNFRTNRSKRERPITRHPLRGVRGPDPRRTFHLHDTTKRITMDKRELEQTLVLIKPDALKQSLTGYMLSLLSEVHTGLRFAGAKIVTVHAMLAEEHYAEHRGKPFFPSLIDYITGRIHYSEEDAWKRRVVALIYQGPDAIKKIRDIAGPTNPQQARDSKPGSVRALGTVIPVEDGNGAVVDSRIDNLIHASANPADAEREIKLWFAPYDIPPAMHEFETAESDEHYYFKGGRLFTSHEPGSACIMAPGDVAWQSDLEALRSIMAGRKTACSLNAVVAKYLINEQRELISNPGL